MSILRPDASSVKEAARVPACPACARKGKAVCEFERTDDEWRRLRQTDPFSCVSNQLARACHRAAFGAKLQFIAERVHLWSDDVRTDAAGIAAVSGLRVRDVEGALAQLVTAGVLVGRDGAYEVAAEILEAGRLEAAANAAGGAR